MPGMDKRYFFTNIILFDVVDAGWAIVGALCMLLKFGPVAPPVVGCGGLFIIN